MEIVETVAQLFVAGISAGVALFAVGISLLIAALAVLSVFAFPVVLIALCIWFIVWVFSPRGSKEDYRMWSEYNVKHDKPSKSKKAG